MRQANQLINQAAVTAVTPVKNRPLSSADLTKEQTEAVAYFFFRLKDWDSGRYLQLFPDETSQRIAKRSNAPFLKDWSREYIDQGFDKLKQHKQNEPGDMRFWTVDEVIGFIKNGGISSEHVPPAGIYKPFRKDRALESEQHKSRRKKAGESALTDMKAMFDL